MDSEFSSLKGREVQVRMKKEVFKNGCDWEHKWILLVEFKEVEGWKIHSRKGPFLSEGRAEEVREELCKELGITE